MRFSKLVSKNCKNNNNNNIIHIKYITTECWFIYVYSDGAIYYTAENS